MLSLFESKVIIMGLFGKKKYEKNMTRDNQFLKNYAIKVNGLINFTEGNEKVTQELEALKKDFGPREGGRKYYMLKNVAYARRE